MVRRSLQDVFNKRVLVYLLASDIVAVTFFPYNLV